jgi:hypothetical protein
MFSQPWHGSLPRHHLFLSRLGALPHKMISSSRSPGPLTGGCYRAPCLLHRHWEVTMGIPGRNKVRMPQGHHNTCLSSSHHLQYTAELPKSPGPCSDEDVLPAAIWTFPSWSWIPEDTDFRIAQGLLHSGSLHHPCVAPWTLPSCPAGTSFTLGDALPH